MFLNELLVYYHCIDSLFFEVNNNTSYINLLNKKLILT